MTEENLSVIEEHELDYQRRLERFEFTDGISREELIQRINTHRLKSEK